MSLLLAAGGAASTQNLSPALFVNSNTFYTHTVTASYTLAPTLYVDTDVFFAATVAIQEVQPQAAGGGGGGPYYIYTPRNRKDLHEIRRALEAAFNPEPEEVEAITQQVILTERWIVSLHVDDQKELRKELADVKRLLRKRIKQVTEDAIEEAALLYLMVA